MLILNDFLVSYPSPPPSNIFLANHFITLSISQKLTQDEFRMDWLTIGKLHINGMFFYERSLK